MVTASAAARGGGGRGDGQSRRGESLGCRSRREEKGSFGEEKQKPGWCGAARHLEGGRVRIWACYQAGRTRVKRIRV
jgi:hypothetical protein